MRTKKQVVNQMEQTLYTIMSIADKNAFSNGNIGYINAIRHRVAQIDKTNQIM